MMSSSSNGGTIVIPRSSANLSVTSKRSSTSQNTISAPCSLILLFLNSGVVCGVTTTAGIPSCLAAYDIACPWFPLDEQIIPLFNSSSDKLNILFIAPLILNEFVT